MYLDLGVEFVARPLGAAKPDEFAEPRAFIEHETEAGQAPALAEPAPGQHLRLEGAKIPTPQRAAPGVEAPAVRVERRSADLLSTNGR